MASGVDLLRSDWSCNSPFDTPSVNNSLCNCSAFNSSFYRPLAQILSNTIKGKHSCSARIFGVFRRGYPVDVFWFVVAVIINSIQLVVWRWSTSYVGKECLKTISPFLVNGNSSSTISTVSFHARTGASPNHGTPRFPFFAFVGFAVCVIPVILSAFDFAHYAILWHGGYIG